MKKSALSALLAAICLAGSVLAASAQPKIPRNTIPADIDPKISQHLHRLYSSDPVQRGLAAYSLGQVGPKAARAVPFLIATLEDYDPLQRGRRGDVSLERTSVSEEAERALVKIGNASVVPLIAILKDQSWGLREISARVLGQIRDSRSVEPLIGALRDAAKSRDPTGHLDRGPYFALYEIANALGLMGDARAVEPLVEVLRDTNLEKRAVVPEPLGKLRDARATLPLMFALTNRDEDMGIRERAALALGEIKDVRAVDALIAVLDENNPNQGFMADVRGSAAVALGEIKDGRAVRPLIVALSERKDEYRNEFVRQKAAAALSGLTGQNFGEDQETWQRWWERNKEQFIKHK